MLSNSITIALSFKNDKYLFWSSVIFPRLYEIKVPYGLIMDPIYNKVSHISGERHDESEAIAVATSQH